MKIGGPMEVTRDYFDFIRITIDRITEIDALVDALESAVNKYEIGSKERETLVSMYNTLTGTNNNNGE
jgi:hypothetical protein